METKKPGKIRKLDEVVINRIAAGEVIQRPANALKELLENSLDAGAKNIQVIAKLGGLKLLQIQDDGTGINREDLPIVCERFTTSKLQTFEDLQSIGTYGFRGEALASISHVAHLSIVTKTADSNCAYRAEYTDGKLKKFPPETNCSNPRPCAGNRGTVIIAEDLFYNMDTRRRALKNTTEEYNKIVDVVTKYSIHNSTVGFLVKKFGETMPDIRTNPNSTTIDNIKTLYGANIARELIEVSCNDDSLRLRMKGYVSNINYSTKKLTFLLFINHRLVDCSGLRRSIESVYTNYLPKGSHPFLYMSLEIDPASVDVNVHPTKHEVHFLHEDEVSSLITNTVESTLLGSNESRTFYVQSLLPGACGPSTSTANIIAKRRKADYENNAGNSFNNTSNSFSNQQPNYAKNMVRTDPKDQKLEKFFPSITSANETFLNKQYSKLEQQQIDSSDSWTSGPSTKAKCTNRREIRLRSVKNLRSKIEEDCHSTLLTVLRNHTFVGCVNRTLALIQHDVDLYLCNTYKLTVELFYQRIIHEFGNFGRITISDPITLKELIAAALESESDSGIVVNNAEEIENLLLSKAKMLEDYFSFKFDTKTGQLLTVPLLLDKYFPLFETLPSYLLRLARLVNWSDEQACFESFAHNTALFYAVQPGDDKLNEEKNLSGHSWKWTIEHIIYPELKKCLLPPKNFAEDSTVMVISHLPDLYKVFERC